jgi:sugar/nucleoside kinase (ribokinase family)
MVARAGFICAGTFCLDRNIAIDHWPSEDMIGTAQDLQLAGGGPACNFAIDLRKLDPTVPVVTQTLVGADADGDFLVAEAARFGIGTSGFSRTDKARTQVTDAYYSVASGRRTHILFEGTAGLMTPDHFDFSGTTARFLHLGLPGIHRAMDGPWQGDPNGWVTVLKRARSAGLETNLELVSVEEGRLRDTILPCLPYLTTLVCNDFEIGALAEIRTVRVGQTDLKAVEAAARAVLHRGAMELVAVHFTMGSVLVARDGDAIRAPSVAVPAEAIKGANGAGDAFAAGFFYGRHMGWAHLACLKMGHATAAACLRAPGTYEAVESAAACLDLAETWGWRS